MKIVYTLFFLVGAFKLDAQYFNYLHTYDTTAEVTSNIFLRPDNTLFVTGFDLDLNTFLIGPLWMNFSTDGNAIVSKKHFYTDSFSYNFGYYGSAKALSNGGYVIPYTPRYYSGNPDRFYNMATLMFLNAQLDTILVKRYTDSSLYSEGFYDCDILPDGSFLLGGIRESSFVSQQGVANIKGMVTRIDAQGNLMWKHIYQK